MKRTLHFIALGIITLSVSKINAQRQPTIAIQTISKNQFLRKVGNLDKQRKYKGQKPIIIEFCATWCTPCRKLSPILLEVAKENKNIIIYKVNVDQERELAQQFKIFAIPTLLFIPINGKPSKNLGLISRSELDTLIQLKLLRTESSSL
jgi:Thioredoxin domain-containing protein